MLRHTTCRAREIMASWLAVVTRRAGRVRGDSLSFLRELRDFLNELDDRPLDWAVLAWKSELPIS